MCTMIDFLGSHCMLTSASMTGQKTVPWNIRRRIPDTGFVATVLPRIFAVTDHE